MGILNATLDGAEEDLWSTRSRGNQGHEGGTGNKRIADAPMGVVVRVSEPTSQIEALLLRYPIYHSQRMQRRNLVHKIRKRSRQEGEGTKALTGDLTFGKFNGNLRSTQSRNSHENKHTDTPTRNILDVPTFLPECNSNQPKSAPSSSIHHPFIIYPPFIHHSSTIHHSFIIHEPFIICHHSISINHSSFINYPSFINHPSFVIHQPFISHSSSSAIHHSP